MSAPPIPKQLVERLRLDASESARTRALAMQQGGEVSELTVEQHSSRLNIRGKVHDSGADCSYRVSVTADGEFVESACGCSARPPCAHAVALARHYADGAERSGFNQPSARWRALVDRLTPFKVFRIPPVGEEIFVHWVELKRLDGGAWSFTLRWRLHRPGAKSMGRGRLVNPCANLVEPPTSMSLADQKVVELVCAATEGSKRATPTTVEVGVGDIDAVLRLLSRAPYVYWEGGGGRVAFDPVPAIPSVVAEDDGEGLRLTGKWSLAEGNPWHPALPRVFAGPWPWVEDKGVLRPIFGVADGTALAELMERGAWVGPSEVASFLASGVSAITGWGAKVELEVGDDREMVVDTRPVARIYLTEVRSGLEAGLRFAYGDFEIPSENPDPVLMVQGGAGEVCVKRDIEAEFSVVSELLELGFRPEEPGYYSISADAALDFILLDLPELSKRWEVFGRDNLKRHRVDTRAMTLRARLGTNVDWLDLYVEGELEGDPVEVERILKALRRGSRYVRLGDGSHAVLPDEWGARLRELVDELGLKESHTRLPLYRASAVEELASEVAEMTFDDGEQWEKLCAKLNQREDEAGKALAAPEGLTCTMRPYQLRGLSWLKFLGDKGLGGVLADEMGLGKTVQALALLLMEKDSEGEDEIKRGPSLVVSPTSVVPNWEAEVKLHAPGLTTLRYHGAQRDRFHDDFGDYDLVITSYAVLRRDVEVLSGVEWNYVILDEAQAIKNAATLTAQATRRLAARRRLGLTGTLLENHLGELWSHFQFVMPGFMGSQKHFVEHYQRPIAAGDADAAERLRRRIRPFVLRRMKLEVAPELPPKVENTLWCELGEEQMTLYRSILEAGRQKVFDAMDKGGVVGARACVLEVLLRLRQVCCHPAVLPDELGKNVPSAKFEQFIGFVSEVIAEGGRVLVYSQFVQMLTIIRQWFEKSGIPHLYMDGRTKDREGRVRRFQEDESIRAFLVSLRAGGTGINLTGADYVVLFDPWWNPAVEAQATDRAHRIGRESAVFCYKMVARATVEEKIQLLQGEKRAVTDEFIRSEAKWGINLDEAVIEELFSTDG